MAGDSDGDDDGGSAQSAARDEVEAAHVRGEVPVERRLTSTHRLISFRVGHGHGLHWRLDKYLHALCPTLSRTLLQRWLDAGCARIDGVTARTRMKLHPGQLVEMSAPLALDPQPTAPEGGGIEDESDEDPGPAALAGLPPPVVRHRSAGAWVMDKPAGMLAHQAGRTLSGTLLNHVQDLFTQAGLDPRQARLVNRIDRDTSGLVLVSTDEEAHRHLALALGSGRIHKVYRAICVGIPDPGEGSWTDPIAGPLPGSVAMAVAPEGRPSRTDYRVVAVAEGPSPFPFALLDIVLHTGRQHQIRVHASAHGHALVGDWVYGQPCRESIGQALHAGELVYPDPVSGDRVRVTAPLPPALEELWGALSGGRPPSVCPLTEDQRSRLGLPRLVLPRRPRWLSDEEFETYRRELPG